MLTAYHPDSLMMIAVSAFIMSLIGIVYPNYSANCSNLFKHIAGTAAAVRGITTMIGASIITGMVSLLPIHSVTAFLTIYPLLTVIALFAFTKQKESISSQSSSVERRL